VQHKRVLRSCGQLGGILACRYILPRAIGDEVHKVLAIAVGVIIVLLRQAWQL